MIMYDYDVNLKGMFIYNPMHNYAYLFNFYWNIHSFTYL